MEWLWIALQYPTILNHLDLPKTKNQKYSNIQNQLYLLEINIYFCWKYFKLVGHGLENKPSKKVLLRERKRLTARCVACAHYAALSPDGVGGRWYSIQPWMVGVPHPADGGTPSFLMGYAIPGLDRGILPCQLDGVLPSGPGMEYPPPIKKDGVLPYQLDGVFGVFPSVKKDGVPPSARWGTPLKVEQTRTCENITSRRTTYAGGNYTYWMIMWYLWKLYTAHNENSWTLNILTFPPHKFLLLMSAESITEEMQGLRYWHKFGLKRTCYSPRRNGHHR